MNDNEMIKMRTASIKEMESVDTYIKKVSKPTGVNFYNILDETMNKTKKCIVLEIEDSMTFNNKMNEYLSKGYKVESSSCNSRYYKAILVLREA